MWLVSASILGIYAGYMTTAAAAEPKSEKPYAQNTLNFFLYRYLMQNMTAVMNTINKNKYCVKAPHIVTIIMGISCFKRGLSSVVISFEWRYKNTTPHMESIQYILIKIVRSAAADENPQNVHTISARYFDLSKFFDSLYKNI